MQGLQGFSDSSEMNEDKHSCSPHVRRLLKPPVSDPFSDFELGIIIFTNHPFFKGRNEFAHFYSSFLDNIQKPLRA